jgi:hypothetical protein
MGEVCPTPRKKAYDSITAAVYYARADCLRAYRCKCGKWHLTSKVRRGKRMGVSR